MTPSSTLPSWLDNMPSVLKMTFAFTVLYENVWVRTRQLLET